MPRRERRTVGIRLSPKFVLLVAVLVLTVFAAAACGRDSEGDADAADGGDTTAETQDVEALSGRIVSDGSSTVGPLTTAAAERFREEQPDVNIEVGISGTGGGFERFCAGETDVSNASRPIDEEEEVPICEKNGIEYTELQVAVDALTVVVNPENDWAECLTVEQLNTMWGPEAEGEITNWSQVDPSFPDQQLSLAEPGTEAAQDGSYNPLARPLFVYVKNESLARPEVAAFLTYYLENIEAITEDALFIPPSTDVKDESVATLESAIGSEKLG